MINLTELEQFVAFADLGTLSKVSEQFHISTPTITRTMQHIEESFGVSLFSRSKNRIMLNETGFKAVECSRAILKEAQLGIREVREFDKSQRTIIVKSCAPAPLWSLLPTLSSAFPDMTISSSICQNDEIISDIENKTCDIAILPFELTNTTYQMAPYMKEHLSICIKKEHHLASRDHVSFSDINGYNFLLRSELGFWDTMCREKMPSSRFLVQKNEFEFNELVNSSSLPCFTTDIAINNHSKYKGRISIPITDEEANVTFFITTHDFSKYKSVIMRK